MQGIDWTTIGIALAVVFIISVFAGGAARFILVGALIIFMAFGMFDWLQQIGGLP